MLLVAAAEAHGGDASLWGEHPPHFVHWREEQRRLESGIDPYTGEPDPYLGVEFG
ncbi:hypothetical protein Slala05_82750 [Streptomyces lavendulae subsp. lavendulae]|nr:hypothetical protein Slala05_82750 [Streptomyces lavendulae subsp. lavendulae]